jgi:hypothetical protein
MKVMSVVRIGYHKSDLVGSGPDLLMNDYVLLVSLGSIIIVVII